MGCSGSKGDTTVVSVEPTKEAPPIAVKSKEKPKRRPSKEELTNRRARTSAGFVVADDTEEVSAAFTVPVHEKEQGALDRIAAATVGNSLFEGLTPEQKHTIAMAMYEVRCEVGTKVIAQGDMGDSYFVVDSGEYECTLAQTGDTPVCLFGTGGSFGELALLYNSPRASTVTCTSAGVLWGLDRKTFRHILMASNKGSNDQLSTFLKAVPVLSPLTDAQRRTLATELEQLTYEDGEVLWEVGDAADWLCLIKEGTVLSASDYREPITFELGSFFGTQVPSAPPPPLPSPPPLPPTRSHPVLDPPPPRLLNVNPNARLGSIHSSEVREHPFFDRIDFVQLLQRNLPTPYVPVVKDPLDSSNYDHYDEPDLTKWDKYNVNDDEAFGSFGSSTPDAGKPRAKASPRAATEDPPL